MAVDTNVSQLIINKMSAEQYKEAREAGTLSSTELYFVEEDAVAEGGGGSGGGLKRAARVVTTENAVSLSVTGLSVKLPATIALYNTGSATNTGAMLTVNGVRKGVLGGSMNQNNNQRPGNKFWFAETETSTMNCYMMLANNTFATVDFGKAPETIHTVVIEPAYPHDGETKYFQSGTIIEIYEGVFPNV